MQKTRPSITQSVKWALLVTASLMLAGAAIDSAWAQIPNATLTTIFPMGGKVGSTVEVSIGGGDLDEADRLLFNHPEIRAQPKMAPADGILDPQPIPNQFQVAIGDKVPPGFYEVRAVGRFGVSNPRVFVVGLLPEKNEPGGNNELAKAADLGAIEAGAVGSVVNGRVDGGAADYYKFKAQSGQRVLIQCAAHRLHSRLDPRLSVLDSQGRLIRETPHLLERDTVLSFTASEAGDYIIKLHDFAFDGGGEYYYRLTVGVTPHIDFVLPPIGAPGSSQQFTIYGRNLPGGKPASNMTVDGQPLQQVEVKIELPKEDASSLLTPVLKPHRADTQGYVYQLQTPGGPTNPVLIEYAQAPVVMEQEPNNEPAQAQKVNPPCEYVAQFHPARDRDWVAFDAKKGEVYWIEVIAHRAGLPSDPYVLIQQVTKNDKGEESVRVIADVDDPRNRNNSIGTGLDASTDDPSYRFTAGADATFRVMVVDREGSARSDPRFVYRLLIRKEQPDFTITAAPSDPTTPLNNNAVGVGKVMLLQSASTVIDVRIERKDGFNGPIDVQVEGLPTGVTSPGAKIPANQSSASLILTAADKAASWVGPIRIVARAQINNQPVKRLARTINVVWGTGNITQQRPEARLSNELTLAIVGQESSAATVKLGAQAEYETSLGGIVDVPIKVVRRDGFKTDMALIPVGLPPNMKAGNVTIKGNAADGSLKLQVNNNRTPPGVYTLYVKAETKYKYRRNPQAHARALEEQKKVDAAIKDQTAKNKSATEAKNNAVQAAQAAAAALKQAEQTQKTAQAEAKNLADAAAKAAPDAKADAQAKSNAAAQKLDAANKTLAQAQQAAKQAEQTKTDAEKKANQVAAQLKKAQDLKKVVDKRVTDTKNASNPKDRTVRFVSTPIFFKITARPIELSPKAPDAPLKPGGKAEIVVSIVRKYGFDAPVECTFEPPRGVAGLSAQKITIAKGQTQGKLEITAAANAAVGDHTATIRARFKFNNLNLDMTQPVVVKVAK